jgi:hypothetical protein
MSSTESSPTLISNPTVEDGADASRLDAASPAWHGFLKEFRNQLTALRAAASALGADEHAPGGDVGGAVFETERNVRGLTSLVALLDASFEASVDASARTLEPIIVPLGAVVDRAVRLAAPSAGPRTSIVVSVPRGTGVRNRGAALEGLLAALVVELARSHAGADADRCRSPLVRIEADVGRRGLALEVSCDGARLDPSSSRFARATELADELGAALTVEPEGSVYVVQFAMTSS